jgi:hypothetical protein
MPKKPKNGKNTSQQPGELEPARSKQTGRPWLKWYVNDWLGDEKLRLCSLAARGLWSILLCVAHKSARRGYVQSASGKPLSLDELATLCGCSTEEVSRLLHELETAGVISVNRHGVIYSRKMLREQDLSEKRRQAGRMGAEKTHGLPRQTDLPGQMVKQSAWQNVVSSVSNTLSFEDGGAGEELFLPGFAVFMAAYPKDEDKDEALQAWLALGPDPPLQAAILAGLERWKQSAQWKEDPRWIPHAAKWLADRRWEKGPASEPAAEEHRPQTMEEIHEQVRQRRAAWEAEQAKYTDADRKAAHEAMQALKAKLRGGNHAID